MVVGGNTYNGNAWSLFTNKYSKNLYIYFAQLQIIVNHTSMYSTNDALIVQNICIEIL